MSLHKEEKSKVIKEYAQSSTDTGSTVVQIAIFTEKIKILTQHCKKNAKDYSSRRGLLQMVADRTKLLRYLERKDAAQYKAVIGRLGLRK